MNYADYNEMKFLTSGEVRIWTYASCDSQLLGYQLIYQWKNILQFRFCMRLLLNTSVLLYIKMKNTTFLIFWYHIILRTIINFVFEDWPLTNCNAGRVSQALFLITCALSFFYLYPSVSLCICIYEWSEEEQSEDWKSGVLHIRWRDQFVWSFFIVV